jgi:hypothetical protein
MVQTHGYTTSNVTEVGYTANCVGYSFRRLRNTQIRDGYELKTMEYHHVLLSGEIETGRLNFGLPHLSAYGDALAWFEAHSGAIVGVYRDDGTLIKRSIRIDRHKANSWRFNCGIDTFVGQKPGNVVIIRDRDDGNIEISLGQSLSQDIPSIRVESTTAPLVKPPNIPRSPSAGIGGGENLGELVNFRGLQHAPTNEQGVVFLFGMVCRELGYLIEVVQSGYPDCQGKRRISKNPERWRRVYIEFEYQSKNFEVHRHDPQLCNVIVCWEDNWPECPIEVVELREEIRNLRTDVD